MNFHILTLFPEMVEQGLSASIIGRAAKQGLLSIEAVNIRDYTKDKHKKVDDYPYGGGAGMLMQAQPVYDAWKATEERIAGRKSREASEILTAECREPEETGQLAAGSGVEPADTKPEQNVRGRHTRTIYVTPQGVVFHQSMAKEFAKEKDLVILCGHYEGIDERVLDEIVTDYVSIGDYVLTGGELPAMVMVDAIARMVPGVLGNGVSGEKESLEGNLLEHPQYSRPEVWMGKSVPEVLLSGNQKKIDAWRLQESEKRTKMRRPDLYQKYEELVRCRDILKKQKLLHIDMTELISRGKARLVYADGANITLQDTESGIYFHTAEDAAVGRLMLEKIREDAAGEGCRYLLEPVPDLITVHQEFMVEPARKILGLELFMTCHQAVYTRKEKLPVTGLYSPDGKVREGQPLIQRLDLSHLPFVMKNYETMDDPDYIRERIEKGRMFGAFFGEELAGFVGLHGEGSCGMLEVLPEYRGRKLGKALETYIINYCLELGCIPYGQVAIENEISRCLQESLGLCFSKTPVWFMEKKSE